MPPSPLQQSLEKATLERFQVLSLHQHERTISCPLCFWPIKLTTGSGITKHFVSKAHSTKAAISFLVYSRLLLFWHHLHPFPDLASLASLGMFFSIWYPAFSCWLHLGSFPSPKHFYASHKNIIPVLSHCLSEHVVVKKTILGISFSEFKSYSLYFLAMWSWPNGLTHLSFHISSENWFWYY